MNFDPGPEANRYRRCKATTFLWLIASLAAVSCSPESDTEANEPELIWGDRLSITGDFNGNGNVDTLHERYISLIDSQETNKYAAVSYWEMMEMAHRKQPAVQLRSSDTSIPDLFISTITGQLFGLSYLRNEGDLDQDGRDEVGIVVDWADASFVNGFVIYSLRDTGWVVRWASEIRDYDLETDSTGAYIDTTFEGFLFRDVQGRLRVRTYDSYGRVDSLVTLLQ